LFHIVVYGAAETLSASRQFLLLLLLMMMMMMMMMMMTCVQEMGPTSSEGSLTHRNIR